MPTLKKYWPFLLILLAVLFICAKFASRASQYPSTMIAPSAAAPFAPGRDFTSSRVDMMAGNGADSKMAEELMPPISEPIPQGIPANSRMVISDSSLSLLVTNVKTTSQQILTTVEANGGYMVSTNVSNPDKKGSGDLIVRVPSKNLSSVLNEIRGLAKTVVSENLNGRDVTDQYVNLDTRIAQYQQTKEKMQELLDDAKEVSDIVNITNQIQNIQSQIDALIGQQQYLSQSAEFAKVTIFLSTDELALPYQPEQPFSPETIFKTAVRSLLSFLSSIAASLIWFAVYSIIWIPVLIVIYIVYRKITK